MSIGGIKTTLRRNLDKSEIFLPNSGLNRDNDRK